MVRSRHVLAVLPALPIALCFSAQASETAKRGLLFLPAMKAGTFKVLALSRKS